MSFRVAFQALIFLAGLWAFIVVGLSLLGDPVLLFPIDDSTALFPPLYRYETLRLSLISTCAYFALLQIFAPQKKLSAGQVVATALSFVVYIAAIKIIPEGQFYKEATFLVTVFILVGMFYYISKPREKKIFRRR